MLGNNTKTRILETLWSNNRFELNAQIVNKMRLIHINGMITPQLNDITKSNKQHDKCI